MKHEPKKIKMEAYVDLLSNSTAYEIRNIIGEELGKSLDFWRDMRNEVDYSPYPVLNKPLQELALDAVSSAESCLSEVENYLSKRSVKL